MHPRHRRITQNVEWSRHVDSSFYPPITTPTTSPALPVHSPTIGLVRNTLDSVPNTSFTPSSAFTRQPLHRPPLQIHFGTITTHKHERCVFSATLQTVSQFDTPK